MTVTLNGYPVRESLRLTREELREAHAGGTFQCQVCGLLTYRLGGMAFTWTGQPHNFVCNPDRNTTAERSSSLDETSAPLGRRCEV